MELQGSLGTRLLSLFQFLQERERGGGGGGGTDELGMIVKLLYLQQYP